MSQSHSRRTKSKENKTVPVTTATEAHTIVFEWPLTGLKQIFDSTKSDQKSKVVKSVAFGEGRWTVLFYAQSGQEQNVSLYLNAEPIASERVQPMLNRTNGSEHSFEEQGWSREGKYKFSFSIQNLDKTIMLGTKEARDHAFCHKTSNWGWAQFAKREAVYYNMAPIQQADAMLITVTIEASPEQPKVAKPTSLTVPPALMTAVGALLDDPEHSDVVFHLVPPPHLARSGMASKGNKRIFAIKKILSARSEYFSDMFSGGFKENELSDGEDDSSADGDPAQAGPSHDNAGDSSRSLFVGDGSFNAHGSRMSEEEDGISSTGDYAFHEPLLDDSDVEIDEEAIMNSSRLNRASRDIQIISDDEAEEEEDARFFESRPTGSLVGHNNGSQVSLTTQGDPGRRSSGSSSNGAASREKNRPAINSTTDSASTNSGKRNRQAQQDVPMDTDNLRSGPGRRSDGRKRRKVVVPDASYATFKALLFFLYTDQVTFAPLTSNFLDADVAGAASGMPIGAGGAAHSNVFSSQRNTLGSVASAFGSDFGDEFLKAHRRRRDLIEAHAKRYPERPHPCSAKALYRLADKLNISDLKKRAQDHISQSLTVQNIVWEAFSSFTCQFPDVLKMETDFLLRHWTEVKKTEAMKSIFGRSHAHPGLAEVWPYLLSQLEYRAVNDSDEEEGPGLNGEA